jgi:hypothetical protein
MSIILKQPITGPAAWSGPDLESETSWLRPLTPDIIDGLDSALAALKAKGLRFPDFTREDFPIGPLGRLLPALADELENGRGFAAAARPARAPLHRRRVESRLCYGIGLHLGTPVRQNPRGDLLGEVRAVGDPTTSDHAGVRDQPVPALPLRPVGRGGPAVRAQGETGRPQQPGERGPHLQRDPGAPPRVPGPVLPALFYFAHLCEPQPSLSPIFSYHEGKLSCRYLRQYIELGHEIKGVPLSLVEIEALDLFDRIMHDPGMRLDMMLEPGDLQFANNYAVLHSRNGFEDHDEVAAAPAHAAPVAEDAQRTHAGPRVPGPQRIPRAAGHVSQPRCRL